jgi:hypothetical protein
VGALEDLHDRAAAADLGQVLPGPGIPAEPGAIAPGLPAPPPDPEREKWIAGARRFCGMGRGMFTVLQAEWTDQKIDALGIALADCAKHYNWKFSGFFSHPLLALIGAGGVLAWPIARPIAMPYIDAALKELIPTPAAAAGEERKDSPTG